MTITPAKVSIQLNPARAHWLTIDILQWLNPLTIVPVQVSILLNPAIVLWLTINIPPWLDLLTTESAQVSTGYSRNLAYITLIVTLFRVF